MSFVVEYVLGFAFDEECKLVALIKKNRPDWQKGRWNGIGGHREGLEQGQEAMRREFLEETGVDTEPRQWKLCGRMFSEGSWRALVYSTKLPPKTFLRQTTDELPQFHYVYIINQDAYPVNKDIYIENLRALIELCRMRVDHTGTIPTFTLDYSNGR